MNEFSVDAELRALGLQDVGLNADWSVSAFQMDGGTSRDGLLFLDNENGTWTLRDTLKSKEYVTLLDEYVGQFAQAWLISDLIRLYYETH
jgi:hypothetical protein